MSEIVSLYAYDDTAELTSQIVWWASSSSNGSIMKLGANSELETAAVDALLGSPNVQNITSLEFTEIIVSVENFERLLTIPNLVELEICGGSSSDWSGPEYTYPTLSAGHYKVLATSPHAKKLQTITLDKEEIGDEMKAEIQAALPNLRGFNVF